MTQPARVKLEYALALLALVAGGGIMLIALSKPWVTGRSGGSGVPTIAVSVTGGSAVPLALGAAVLILAGAAGVPATRGRGRVIVGAVLVVAALAAVVATLRFGLAGSAATEALSGAGVDAAGATVSPWWVLCAAGGVLGLLGGVATIARGRNWPVLAGRYERAGAAAEGPKALSAAGIWDALDRGEDPTAGDHLPQ